MSTTIDLSQPLSDKQITDLKSRYSLEYVERLIAQAAGSDFVGEQAGGNDANEEVTGLGKMTGPQLKKYAADREIDLGGATKVADMRAAIDKAESQEPSGDGDTVKYEVHQGDDVEKIVVEIPADTEEDEIAAAVKAAAVEAGADEEKLTGFAKVETAS